MMLGGMTLTLVGALTFLVEMMVADLRSPHGLC
jgi:hypothetical protein